MLGTSLMLAAGCEKGKRLGGRLAPRSVMTVPLALLAALVFTPSALALSPGMVESGMGGRLVTLPRSASTGLGLSGQGLGMPQAPGWDPFYRVGLINDISADGCPGAVSPYSSADAGNGEVETAVDRRLGYVYAEWMGCQSFPTDDMGFARSTDGGRTFQPAIELPGRNSPLGSVWDPSVAVAPDGTVYAAFMGSFYTDQTDTNFEVVPEVAVSFDHGATFTRLTKLNVPGVDQWGDRDFIAVGPDGTVYVTWDYGPSYSEVVSGCAANGSCYYTNGDLNGVIEKSTDQGKTWSTLRPFSPGFPDGGVVGAPIVVEPNGRIDILYLAHPTDPQTLALSPGQEYFTSSTDGGTTWSAPVVVGRDAGSTALPTWWIDGSIAFDQGGNLYATWDTQGTNPDGTPNDIGWLSYSTDNGAHWSAPQKVPGEQVNAPHIVQVTGGPAGIAYAGWLTDSDPRGYAMFLRSFSIGRGWLTAPFQVSTAFGDPTIWPGDTFGLSTVTPTRLALSWGSATPDTGGFSRIFATPVQAVPAWH